MIIYSPIEAGKQGRSPLIDPPRTETKQSFIAEAQPPNIGLSYINNPSQQPAEVSLTPDSPLKSAIEVPRASSKGLGAEDQ
jgi:hypothetical protein